MQKEIFYLEQVSYYDKDERYGIFDFSLSIKNGDIIMILGPEASGKSLIVSLLTAQVSPLRGKIFFQGKDIALFQEREIEKMRTHIGLVSNNYALVNNLSLFDNIALPLRYHGQIPENEIHNRITAYLENFGLLTKKSLRPQLLSDSEKMRTSFLRALMLNPDLIILQEALDGKCPIASANFMQVVFKVLKEKNIALLATGYQIVPLLPEESLVLLLYRGRIVFSGTKKEFLETNNPYVLQYTKNPLQGPMQSFSKT